MSAPATAAPVPQSSGGPITIPPWLQPFIWLVPGAAGGLPGTNQPALPVAGGPPLSTSLSQSWLSLSVGWRRVITAGVAILLILVVVRVVRR